jgi:hypothetical protein
MPLWINWKIIPRKKKENDGFDLISKIKDMVTNNNNANNINNNKAN